MKLRSLVPDIPLVEVDPTLERPMKAAPNGLWVIRSHSCGVHLLHRLRYLPVFVPGALALSGTESNLYQPYHRTDNCHRYPLGCAMSWT